ncbi:hypothetical protein SLA2020_201970 [Shorea laevis]
MAGDEKQITPTEFEIEKLFKSLDEAEIFKYEADTVTNKPLIQMVPQLLGSCDDNKDLERYFKATSVAIGPLNHQRKPAKGSRIERGEDCKLKLAARLIKSSERTTEYFYKNVKEEIKSLRSCYNSEKVKEWTDEELAWMFLVDGCALLVFMILDGNDKWEEFSVDIDVVRIEKVDFFLLENQLPYKLLKILTDSLAGALRVGLRKSFLKELSNLKELSKKFITNFIKRSFLDPIPHRQHQIEVDHLESPHPDEQQQEEEDPVHLLDLLQSILIVKPKEKSEKQKCSSNKEHWFETQRDDKSKHRPSNCNVKELKAKGIRFKASEKGVPIRDTVFNNFCWVPTLTLAPIFLHNTTMSLLLNLMAYELCPDYKEGCEITSHLSLLNSLIADGEDVKELRDAGVLHHRFGSDKDVAELFNKISYVRVPNLKKDLALRVDINKYCNSEKLHFSGVRASVEADLTQTYFKSPWSFLVLLAALAGLIMTGMQTYYSFRGNKLH